MLTEVARKFCEFSREGTRGGLSLNTALTTASRAALRTKRAAMKTQRASDSFLVEACR
jgi:hypothetical protein